MSIIKAVDRAYRTMRERGWDTVYWAIDLHGVCLKSNYKSGEFEWINPKAREGLQAIASCPNSRIILWSSVWRDDMRAILKFFREHGIVVDDFNANCFEENNNVSFFGQKFYFSVLLDDKAGFDPDIDWLLIIDYLKAQQ